MAFAEGEMNMSRVQEAVDLFAGDRNCAQSIVMTYGPLFGLPPETAKHLAAPLGAGMGFRGDTCGAASGAVLVLGLLSGSLGLSDKEAKDRSYELTRAFLERFEGFNGSARCDQLIGLDIGTPEGLQLAKDRQVFTTTCPKLVRGAAEILESMLRENGHEVGGLEVPDMAEGEPK